ncbi:hypothetical protein LCGC14_2066550 [marine sediment metagenome]|uniref:Uncharacterized protein n=1 Tax=marine sediment metagenome TaxID=412755 RepID=A0A0F9HGQ5_9ZZZZ
MKLFGNPNCQMCDEKRVTIEELEEEVRVEKSCTKIVEKQRNVLGKKSANQALELEKYKLFFKLLKKLLS